MAVTAGSVINFIGQNGYPILSLATLVAVILSVPIALFVGAASRSKIGLVAAAFVVGSLAFHFNNPLGSMAKLGVLAGLAFAALVYFKGERPFGFLAVAFAAVAVTSPLFAKPFLVRPDPVEGTSDLPPYIHIILDEHEPGGFADFAHWPNAYSRHLHTANAVPDIIGDFPARLKAKGYAVEIWQTDFLQFCEDHCATYTQGTFSQLHQMPWREQLQVLSEAYGRRLAIFRSHFTSRTMPSALNGKSVFEEFIDRSKSLGRGEAIIFHALLPHYPYAYTADCELKPLDQWARPHAGKDRLESYAEQRQCAEMLARRAFRDDAIILVHGDHGTRILDRPLTPDIVPTPAELQAGYATLFALRSPGIEGDADPVSVRTLLDGWTPGETPTGKAEKIFLADRKWRPVKEIEFPVVSDRN